MTRVNTCTVETLLAGRSVIIVPPDAKLGLFTLPLSPLSDSPEAALASVGTPGCDVVVCRSLGLSRAGWQAWGRRRNIGGKDRHQTGSGSRGRRVPDGQGRVFYQPVSATE